VPITIHFTFVRRSAACDQLMRRIVEAVDQAVENDLTSSADDVTFSPSVEPRFDNGALRLFQLSCGCVGAFTASLALNSERRLQD
jgi:hypothetical protein